jgi:hypothetical protein
MPPRRLTWKRLAPGIVTLVVLLVVTLAVLAFARVGTLKGDTYRLYVLAEQANDVIKGTDVWLDGQKVGAVAGVGFRSVQVDTSARLLVSLDVLRRYQPFIRRDTRVDFRNGGSLIGATVVYLHDGTARTPALRDGDTLALAQEIDTDAMSAAVAQAGREFPLLLRNLRQIGADLRRTSGHVQTVATEDEGSARLLTVHASRFTQRAFAGNGTLPLLLRDTTLGARAARAAAHADSLLRIVGAMRQTPGRFGGDSSLLAQLSDARDALSIVRLRLRREEGTAGRLRADSAIYRQLGVLERQIGLTIEDIKRDPARYIAF